MNHTVSMFAVLSVSQEENMGQDARILGRGFPTEVGQALALALQESSSSLLWGKGRQKDS